MNDIAANLLGNEAGLSPSLKILALLTLLSLLPAMVLTMTSFIRIVVVLSFVRQGVGRSKRHRRRSSWDCRCS